MIAQQFPNHHIKINTLMNNSNSNFNNRRVQMTPVQHKLRRVGSGNDVGNGEMKKTRSKSPSNTADNILELLDMLQSTVVSPTNTVTSTPRRGRRGLKELITPQTTKDSRQPILRQHSYKTEHCRETTRVRRLPRRASSSMEIKPISPEDFYNESAKTKSSKIDPNRQEQKKRRKALKEQLNSESSQSNNKGIEDESNCSMAENSFFQETNSCFGDFKSEKKKKKKKELEFAKNDFVIGSSTFNTETIEEENSDVSGSTSCGSADDRIDEGELPRRKSKKKHGLVLHSSSHVAASKGEDKTRRRRKKCSSGGKIRNNRTLEEYTGFFFASLGEDNVKHGFGITRFRDGRVFEGLYEHGRMVEGKMTYPVAYQGQSTTTTYIGKFDEDDRSGKGIYTTATGTFLGEFYKDEQEGSGILIYHDDSTDGTEMAAANPAASNHCRRFVGHWKEGQRHGYGKEILADGTVHEEGLWENGLFLE